MLKIYCSWNIILQKDEYFYHHVISACFEEWDQHEKERERVGAKLSNRAEMLTANNFIKQRIIDKIHIKWYIKISWKRLLRKWLQINHTKYIIHSQVHFLSIIQPDRLTGQWNGRLRCRILSSVNQPAANNRQECTRISVQYMRKEKHQARSHWTFFREIDWKRGIQLSSSTFLPKETFPSLLLMRSPSDDRHTAKIWVRKPPMVVLVKNKWSPNKTFHFKT